MLIDLNGMIIDQYPHIAPDATYIPLMKLAIIIEMSSPEYNLDEFKLTSVQKRNI